MIVGKVGRGGGSARMAIEGGQRSRMRLFEFIELTNCCDNVEGRKFESNKLVKGV